MDIIVGKNAGFCYGVQRAVDGAKQEIANYGTNTYCLGEIVHNKEVIKMLENNGMQFIENINQANGITLIRAHGVPKEIYQQAQEMNIVLKDYTCPKVLNIHTIAEEFANKGYFIILTGNKIHPENIGTISYCGNDYYVVENEEEVNFAIEKFKASNIKKLLVLSQTTYSVEKFNKVVDLIKQNVSSEIELIIKNTICSATKVRQLDTEELAQKVDKMVIIGGKNSSNTKKLFEIAKKYCENSYCVENENELNLEWFNMNDKIGIMAGASTPQESINLVIEKISSIEN